MKKIKVFIYSYKNKNLLSFCKDLKQNAVNEISIDLYDQNALDRSEMFSDTVGMSYRHILWDDRKGIYYYRLKSLYGRFDYFLAISDLTIFKFGWDEKLIKECNSLNVVSGKGLTSLKMNSFFVYPTSEVLEEASQSQWISEDFVFLKMSDAILLSKSKFLKKYGDELFSSILLTELNFKIKSMNSSFYDKVVEKEKYLPYSKYHGYNKLLSMIKNKEIKSEVFEKYHNMNLLDLKFLPFETEDVSYYKTVFSIDSENETRFHTGLKRIEIK
jgi:hypothetical protein